MSATDLYAVFEQQLIITEAQFEIAKVDLFKDPLPQDQFALRRALVRELDACLGSMHETRRAITSLRG